LQKSGAWTKAGKKKRGFAKKGEAGKRTAGTILGLKKTQPPEKRGINYGGRGAGKFKYFQQKKKMPKTWRSQAFWKASATKLLRSSIDVRCNNGDREKGKELKIRNSLRRKKNVENTRIGLRFDLRNSLRRRDNIQQGRGESQGEKKTSYSAKSNRKQDRGLTPLEKGYMKKGGGLFSAKFSPINQDVQKGGSGWT